jgi:hypothetical protein
LKKKIHIIEKEIQALEFIFLGIVTFEKEHKLCWGINEKLNINLQLKEENNKQYYISEKDITIKLITNKENDIVLFPEIRNINYIIKIAGNNLPAIKTDFIKQLKKIEFISAILEIDLNKFKKSKKLLSDY